VGALFFFFQAEDGIRDLIVTGVQTCALPISPFSGTSTASAASPSGRPLTETNSFDWKPCSRITVTLTSLVLPGSMVKALLATLRSEERRVGKECRSWWWGYH